MFLCTALFACLYGCSENASPRPSSDAAVLNQQLLHNAKAGIRTGDIILRSGKDFTSYRIRELSDKDKTYSHAGIAFVKDTSVYIYHITPPDLDEPGADTALRIEPLERFAAPSRCFGFGIVRYALSETEITAALQYLDSLYRQKVSFDHSFNLDDPHQMYCSEMVDNTLGYATRDRIRLQRKYFTQLQARKAARYFHLSMDVVTSRTYISIDNLQQHPEAAAIHNYVFLK